MVKPINPIQLAKESCAALQQAEIEIETDVASIGRLSHRSDHYIPACEKAVEAVVRASQQLDPKKPMRYWSPEQIRKVKQLSLEHRVVVRGAFFKPENLQTQIFLSNNVIFLNLLSEGTMNDAELAMGFRHEAGHIRDHQKIKDLLPDARHLLEKERLLPHEFQVLIYGMMMIMSHALIPEEQRRFQELIGQEFQNFENLNPRHYSIFWTLCLELFRWGEEAQLPESSLLAIKNPAIWDSLTKKPRKLSYQDLPLENQWALLAIIASLQETSYWKQAMKRNDLDPKKLAQLDSEKLEFFRMAIRASTKYFYLPKSR